MSLPPSTRDRLRRYSKALSKRDDLGEFIRLLSTNGEPFLFGGAARDVVFGAARRVHDLDIFVSGRIDVDEISRFSSNMKRTNFGGLRMMVGNYEVDLWELDKSYAFRFDAPSYVSIARLLRSVCFSTDGIAVSLRDGRAIATTAFNDAVESRRLDFVVPPDDFEAVVATRIARLVLKLNLTMTPSVATYFVKCSESFGPQKLVDAETRWGGHRILNEISVEQVRVEIEAAISKAFEAIRQESMSSLSL